MTAHAAHRRTQINRWVRLAAVVNIAGPIIFVLLRPWILRFPALGLVVGGVEVAWRALYPARPGTAVLVRVPAPALAPDDADGGPL